ncbi:MAG: glycosyltransferase family A protein [Gemmatimonadota bacterium]
MTAQASRRTFASAVVVVASRGRCRRRRAVPIRLWFVPVPHSPTFLPRGKRLPHHVTVVIPAWNVGRFIDETLESVARQTLAPADVVVIDDGSSDDTWERIQSWVGRMGSTRFVPLTGPNYGLSASRNRGILAGHGDLVAFLDGDDCFLPDHLERLVPAFEAVPSLAVAFGDLMCFDARRGDTGGNLELIRRALQHISRPIHGSSLQLLGPELRSIYVDQAMILPSSWLVSREAIARAGMFNPAFAYGEDVDFLWRVLSTGPAAWYDGPTARRREHDSNASNPRRAAWSEPQVLRVAATLQRTTRDPTPAERDGLARLLQRSIHETGWLASGDGLGAYLAWRDETRRLCGRRAPISMRHFLRASLRTFRRAPAV